MCRRNSLAQAVGPSTRRSKKTHNVYGTRAPARFFFPSRLYCFIDNKLSAVPDRHDLTRLEDNCCDQMKAQTQHVWVCDMNECDVGWNHWTGGHNSWQGASQWPLFPLCLVRSVMKATGVTSGSSLNCFHDWCWVRSAENQCTAHVKRWLHH